jgi:Chemotaxis protein; stimulates methylation of MCP proteins
MAVVRVGIAESGVVLNPDSISTLGLGSCVGVTLYDEKRRIGGMVHVMLPSTELARGADFNRAKFADSAVPDLLKQMIRYGADERRIKAKLAGGAQMFSLGGNADSLLKIGARNVEACRNVLSALRIPHPVRGHGRLLGTDGGAVLRFRDARGPGHRQGEEVHLGSRQENHHPGCGEDRRVPFCPEAFLRERRPSSSRNPEHREASFQAFPSFSRRHDRHVVL